MGKVIDKKDIMLLPLYRMKRVAVVLVTNAKSARRAVEELMKHDVIGFDTETKPNFVAGGRKNRTAVISLACYDRVYVVPVLRFGNYALVDEFVPLFTNRTITKTGINVINDINELYQCYNAVTTRSLPSHAGFVDYQPLAVSAGYKQPGIRNMSAILFSARFTKSDQLSNWESPHLTDKQISYAAADAYLSLAIYCTLRGDTVVTRLIEPREK